MSNLKKTGTWLLLVIAAVAFIAAVFVLGSTLGSLYAAGSIEISFAQVGVLCGGIVAISVLVRCIKQIRNDAECTEMLNNEMP